MSTKFEVNWAINASPKKRAQAVTLGTSTMVPGLCFIVCAMLIAQFSIGKSLTRS